MSAYDDARALMRRAQLQAGAAVRLLESSLSLDLDDVLVGPSTERLRRTEEAVEAKESPTPSRRRRVREWWHEEFEKNWPKEYQRKQPWWTGWRRW